MQRANDTEIRQAIDEAQPTIYAYMYKHDPTFSSRRLSEEALDALATLARVPSAKEIQTANRIMKSAKSPLEAFQDLYWALLNSNEFIMNH